MDSEFQQAQNQLQERFDELPQEIMDVIVGGTLDAIVFELSETYHLTDAQVTSLENEIILVLTFFTERRDFVNHIQESLDVERRIAEAIATEVQSEIFELIEEYLEDIERMRNQEEATQETIAKQSEQKTELQKLAEQFAEKSKRVQQTAPVPAPQTEPTQAEVAPELEKVQPLRTMQGDINRIHGYGAYNEMLEKEKAEQGYVSNQNNALGKNSQS